jgi:hypothetical protein
MAQAAGPDSRARFMAQRTLRKPNLEELRRDRAVRLPDLRETFDQSLAGQERDRGPPKWLLMP